MKNIVHPLVLEIVFDFILPRPCDFHVKYDRTIRVLTTKHITVPCKRNKQNYDQWIKESVYKNAYTYIVRESK